jgi:pimeloyl-ACP methyl ester carboxylesterase
LLFLAIDKPRRASYCGEVNTFRAVTTAFLGLCCVAPLARAQQVSADFLLVNSHEHRGIGGWEATSDRIALTNNLDGAMLRGFMYVGKDKAAPTVFFFPVEGALLEDNDAFYRSLAATGPTVAVYDYRGQGYSGGKVDVARSQKDALVQYDELVKTVRPGHKAILYGASLGSAMATYIASQREVGGMILASPIASAADELRVYGRLLGGPLAKSAPTPEATAVLDVQGMIARSHAPLVVIHSRKDVIVPIEQGRKVFAASTSQPKQFIELKSATHGETVSRPEAIDALKQMVAATR